MPPGKKARGAEREVRPRFKRRRGKGLGGKETGEGEGEVRGDERCPRAVEPKEEGGCGKTTQERKNRWTPKGTVASKGPEKEPVEDPKNV